MKPRFFLNLTAIIVCGIATSAQAGTVWDEAISGDLSSNWLAPTALVVNEGSNVIQGSIGNAGQGVDRDYFSFTVPTGTQLTSITLLGNTVVAGNSSFIGFQVGPQISVNPVTFVGQENLMGYRLYANSDIGTNILSAPLGGYLGPLQSGTYSVWVQETGGPATYGFDFAVTAVPLPGAAMLFMSGMFGLVTAGRFRQRKNLAV